MTLHERLLAPTHVHQQAKVQRNVRASGEERDLLRRAVLEYVEVVLFEIHRQLASDVAHCEPNIYQLDVHANGLLRKHGERKEPYTWNEPELHTGITQDRPVSNASV